MDNKLIIGILVAIIVVLVIALIAVMPNTQKRESEIVVLSNASIYENESFSFRLTDPNNISIINSTVIIMFKDQNGGITNKSVITDSNGIGNLALNGLNAGNYTVQIIFNGNDKYRNSTLLTNLIIKSNTVETQVTTLTASSTSSSSSNDFYGPDVDSGGITKEQAKEYGYTYTPEHGGHYIGSHDVWDEEAGVYHD